MRSKRLRPTPKSVTIGDVQMTWKRRQLKAGVRMYHLYDFVLNGEPVGSEQGRRWLKTHGIPTDY